MHKVAKYKKQKLSSEVLTEILRSDESEDDLVEFINNSFPKSGPAEANNSKKRNKGRVRSNDEESTLHEIDLNGGIAQTNSTRSNVYDLSNNGDSIILGDKPRSARSRLCIAFGLFVSFFALVCFKDAVKLRAPFYSGILMLILDMNNVCCIFSGK